jgi:23S rRNA (guanosine2251-2'-O)-methyltransferase
VIIYGRNPVVEALRGRRVVHRVWATKNAAREPWVAGTRLDVVSAEEIGRLSGSEAHQGVCAEVSEFEYANASDLLSLTDPFLIALDQVQDPQNLGAICRTAECAGATGLVIPERRSAEVTPAVCKASAGAVEHLQLARVRNLADFLGEAREAGAWCYGADAGGDTPYDSVDYRGAVILVLGSEGRGLRPRVAGACDALVSVPLHGRISSLSVSAAAAVLLYAAVSRRN